MRFDASPIDRYLQFIDPVILKEHFLQSIFYLHCQPPLFNFFVGLVIKFFEDAQNYAIVFQIVYLFSGIVLMYSLFFLMTSLRIPAIISGFLTTYFMLSPAVIIYENWLFYTYPITSLLIFATLLLYRYIKTSDTRTGICFFFLLSALVFLRSYFHLFWFVIILLILRFLLKKEGRAVRVSIFIVPLLIILSLYLKNFYLFKTFTTSSVWLGSQTAYMMLQHIPLQKREELYQDGVISIFTFTLYNQLNKLNIDDAKYYNDQYLKAIQQLYSRYPILAGTHIPVLDQVEKSTPGYYNCNTLIDIPISKIMLKDSLNIFIRHPQYYFKSLQTSFYEFFFPGPTDIIVSHRDVIGNYEKIFNFPFYHLNELNDNKIYQLELGKFPLRYLRWDTLSLSAYIFIIFTYFFLIAFGIKFLFLKLRAREDLPVSCTMFFIIFNVIYIMAAINFLGFSGNNRYRFIIDPYFLVLFGLLISHGRSCLIRKGTSVEDNS